MSTLESFIYQTLARAPDLANRVYPRRAPPDTARPYCIQTPVSNTGAYTLKGKRTLDRRLVQIDIYTDAAGSYDDAESLALTVRRALEDAGGLMQNAGGEDEDDTQLRRTRMSFQFWHRPE